MVDIYDFHRTLQTPDFGGNRQKKGRFMQKAIKYFVKGPAMFKRNPDGMPLKCVFRHSKRQTIMEAAHEHMGHRGEQATITAIKQRFYWPRMQEEIKRHVRSCHQCQIRSLRKAEVPIMVSTPATLFTKVYLDLMHIPTVRRLVGIVAGKDDLSGVSEGRAIHDRKAKTIANFFWEQIGRAHV